MSKASNYEAEYEVFLVEMKIWVVMGLMMLGPFLIHN